MSLDVLYLMPHNNIYANKMQYKMKQLKNKTVMVQCKNCIYFKEKGNEHGLCAFDQGLLHRDWDRKCNSFKQK